MLMRRRTDESARDEEDAGGIFLISAARLLRAPALERDEMVDSFLGELTGEVDIYSGREKEQIWPMMVLDENRN